MKTSRRNKFDLIQNTPRPIGENPVQIKEIGTCKENPRLRIFRSM